MATGEAKTGLTTAVAHTRTPPEEPWSAAGEVYRSRVWQDIKNLLQQDELTDVRLEAEGQSIPCHKGLLSAASKFFCRKFAVNPESLEHNLVHVDDIEFETLKSVVSFIYTGYVTELTVEKAERLIPASVNLMLPELTDMCKDFLLHTMENDTSACIVIWRIFKTNSLADLSDKAWQVMLENFQELTASDDFKSMFEIELKEYISDQRMNVENEDPVFEALVTWVTHDVDSRKSRFDSLMENVRLSHCSPSFLRDTVRKEPLMATVVCLKALADALSYFVSYNPQQAGTARRDHSEGNILIAICEDQCLTLRERESRWIRRNSSPGKKPSGSSACVMGDSILITRGYNNGYSKKCWKLSVASSNLLNWAAAPDLNVGRLNHATVCVGSQFYVLGGSHGNALSSVECLDEKTGSWQVICDMPSALSGHISVNYKHFIYVFGGDDPQAIGLDDSHPTYMLDSITKRWSWKADMPETCRLGASVVYRDRIYVLGGEQNCCMSYDPGQDQWNMWKTHSRPAMEHVIPSAVLWKDRIMLCGGEYSSVIEGYNPDTDTWSVWKHQLPQASIFPPVVFAITTCM